MFDPEKFGEAMGAAIREAVAPLQAELSVLKAQIAAIPVPKDGAPGKDGERGADGAKGMDGRDGAPGKDGERGPDGVKGLDGRDGKDGNSATSAMIDRDDCLLLTFADGQVKNLGKVVGRDGIDGKDGAKGADGLSFESFELEYIAESHEIQVKASAAGRVKEIRYPAGGIKHGGYWRDSSKAQAAETWTHGGQTYIAKRATNAEPSNTSPDWELFARRGKDGDNVVRTVKPAGPIPLG